MISSLGKLYAKSLALKITDFLENRGLLIEEQVGFRKDRRCVDHIFTLREALRRRNQRGEMTIAIFIDLRKAYYAVPKHLFCRKFLFSRK